MPFETPRISSGCAAVRAALAAFLSPLDMASSTFRKNVRMRDRLDLLTAARRVLTSSFF